MRVCKIGKLETGVAMQDIFLEMGECNIAGILWNAWFIYI